jgi:hypothetical protein
MRTTGFIATASATVTIAVASTIVENRCKRIKLR